MWDEYKQITSDADNEQENEVLERRAHRTECNQL